jgi:putative oxidoreductase
MNKLLHLSFLPTSVDFGLLLLRLLTGATMIYLHGWNKLIAFQDKVGTFTSPMPQLPGSVAFSLMVFAEVVCAALIVLGLLTRLAAFILIINMSEAFFMVHKGFPLFGKEAPPAGPGELAFLYLGGFLVLLFTGAGRFSVDRR